MSSFVQASSDERWQEMSVNKPIPGEALTVRPGMYPYERPAQFANPEEAFDYVLEKVLEPRMFNGLIATMDAGFPLDTLATAMLKIMFTEGVIDPRAIPIVGIPLTVMLIRMCEAAKIDYNLSFDTDRTKDISEAEIMARLQKEQLKAANSSSKAERAMKDVKTMFGREGLMARPEAFV